MGYKAPMIDFGEDKRGDKYRKIPRGTFVKLLNIVKIGNTKWAEVEAVFNRTTNTGWIKASSLRKSNKF